MANFLHMFNLITTILTNLKILKFPWTKTLVTVSTLTFTLITQNKNFEKKILEQKGQGTYLNLNTHR